VGTGQHIGVMVGFSFLADYFTITLFSDRFTFDDGRANPNRHFLVLEPGDCSGRRFWALRSSSLRSCLIVGPRDKTVYW